MPRDFYPSLLRTAVLVNFAFTARLYDMLRREPTFFTVRQAGPADVIALVAVLSLLAPAAFLLVELIARAIGRRTWMVAHTSIVAVLMAAIALSSLRAFDLFPWKLLLLLAAILAALGTLLYVRYAAARRVVTVLWPAIVVFPGWMLLASPVRAAFNGGFDPPAVDVRVARRRRWC